VNAQLVATFQPRRARLQLAGELDLSTREELERRLGDTIDLGCDHVEVDASAVTYVDCGSLRLLAQTQRRFEEQGRTLTVVGQSPTFTRVARLAGFRSLVTEPG
jgi:anti-anti-sigma factor